MSDTPNTPNKEVTHIINVGKRKPKLVIFDDEPDLLHRFVQQYTELGYTVTGVLVLSRDREHDRALFVDGKIKRELTPEEVAQEAAWHPPSQKTPHFPTIDRALADARFRNEADVSAEDDRQYYEDANHFIYGIKTKKEARTLLNELKPDFVLSDMEMRRPADFDMPKDEQATDDDVVMGNHIMAICAKELPDTARVIHTGKYTINAERMESMRRKHDNDETKINAELAMWRERYEALHAEDNAAAQLSGYRIFKKDAGGQNATAAAIDMLFSNKARDPEPPPR